MPRWATAIHRQLPEPTGQVPGEGRVPPRVPVARLAAAARGSPAWAPALPCCPHRLQDLSSGYWVLVVHFTRREAIKQIEVLQHVATNLGRSE